MDFEPFSILNISYCHQHNFVSSAFIKPKNAPPPPKSLETRYTIWSLERQEWLKAVYAYPQCFP